MSDAQEDELKRLLDAASRRIKQVSDMEAKAAEVDGPISREALMPERIRLIRQVDEILGQLEKMHAKRT
jgi:hypothetical protein